MKTSRCFARLPLAIASASRSVPRELTYQRLAGRTLPLSSSVLFFNVFSRLQRGHLGLRGLIVFLIACPFPSPGSCFLGCVGGCELL